MSCTPCIPSQPKQKCGEKERCSLCQCGKIDARICLPCKHKFCHTCVDKLVPPDSPQTFASCPICTMNPECLKVCYPPKADPCAAPQFACGNNAPCDEWYCYNCFSEGNCKVRAKEFCLDCDVSMCDKHLCQHKSFIKRKKHTLMPVCQYKLMKRKFEVRRCKVHPKHTLLFVCQKCDQIVCQICCACNLCDAGGRHDAQELEIVALDIASAINSNIKDIDCFRRSGEKQIEDGFKFYQCNENDLEKLKQRVCAVFEEKNIELARDKQCILAKCNELICQNRKAVQSNKAEINNILCEAKNVAARANQLLQYSHNVDIATESRNMLNELQSAKAVAFPILQLGKFKLCAQEKALEIPSLVQECEALSAPPCPPPCNPCNPCNPCPPPCSPCAPCPPPCSPCPPLCNPCLPPCNPCSPCPPPCNPCPPMCNPCPPPCNPCPPMCNPCPPPCNPCAPACPPPCSPCPTPPCDPCYSPCLPPSNPCTPSPCPPCPENSYLETTFRFQIDDPFSLQTAYSKMFYVKDLPWNLMAERRTVKRCDVDCNEYLAFFLQCNKNSCDQCWCVEANAELRLINQCNEANSFCRKIQHRFCPEEKDWGYSTFIKWCDAMDSSNGFYKNNKLVLEVHVVASCN